MTPDPVEPNERLDERLKRESRFHDDKYGTHQHYPRHYVVGPTQHVYQKLRKKLQDVRGKRIIEYGCGEGWITADLARMGAKVDAFDVSETAVSNTRSVLRGASVESNCTLAVMPAEKLTYPDESFDLAVGFAIIHHLDLSLALKELHRVLKPGGVAFFAEPLGTNPAIQIYRRLTPQYRTIDERPLVLAELPNLLSGFSGFDHQEYFLTALAAVALVYIPGGTRIYRMLSAPLHSLDSRILRIAPRMGAWAWYTILTITK